MCHELLQKLNQKFILKRWDMDNNEIFDFPNEKDLEVLIIPSVGVFLSCVFIFLAICALVAALGIFILLT